MKKIEKTQIPYYTIICDGKPVYVDNELKKYWKGGDRIGVPLFLKKKIAQQEMRKIRRIWKPKGLAKWFKVVPCYFK